MLRSDTLAVADFVQLASELASARCA